MKSKTTKLGSVIIIITLLSLTSCSDIIKDYVGVYEFKVMDNYYAVDSSEVKPSLIKYKQLHPLKIDLFMIGEELKGTLTRSSYQQVFGKIVINDYTEVKYDFKNIHLVEDVLIMELVVPNKTMEIKLIKSGEDTHLIVPTSGKDEEAELCNKFAITGSNNTQYKVFNGTDTEVAAEIESNDCEINKAIMSCIEKGYNATQIESLRNSFKSFKSNK